MSRTLAHELEGAPLSAERVARLGEALYAELAAAHAAGLVHGRLSAACVGFDPARGVRLLGFGAQQGGTSEGDVRDAARLLAAAAGVDLEAAVLPGFLPPELSAVLAQALSQAADAQVLHRAFADAAEALGADPFELGSDGSTDRLVREVACAGVSTVPLARAFSGNERFELRSQLGAGGFGTVYEAFDRARGEVVAIKLLGRVDGEGLYRFKKEFRALATIQHQNVVRLFELFALDGAWFFTMECVRGTDFVSFTRARPERLRDCLQQLADGVAAIHAAGRLHRDLKPQNVLVAEDGTVKILDFGLVTELEGEQTAESAGTPAYMAPETVASEGQSVRTDWYGVGAILYEALTGRPPFATESGRNVFAEKLAGEPVAVQQLAPTSPDDLARLACALLSRQPQSRPGHLAITAAVGAVVFPSEPAAAESEPLPAHFLGRKVELCTLADALEASRREPRAVVIEGRPGIGKTTLARRFLGEARPRAGACVLASRCEARESLPYRGFDGVIDALSRALCAMELVDAAALLPRRLDAACLASAFPVLSRVPAWRSADRSLAAGLSEGERHTRARAGLVELFARLAERGPLVVFIDDAEWMDEDSLGLVECLLAPAAALPVLVVLAAREGSVAKKVQAQRLVLGGPSPSEVAAMIDTFRSLSAAATEGLHMPTRGVVPALFRR